MFLNSEKLKLTALFKGKISLKIKLETAGDYEKKASGLRFRYSAGVRFTHLHTTIFVNEQTRRACTLMESGEQGVGAVVGGKTNPTN